MLYGVTMKWQDGVVVVEEGANLELRAQSAWQFDQRLDMGKNTDLDQLFCPSCFAALCTE